MLKKTLMLTAAFGFAATAALAAPTSSVLSNGAAMTSVTGHGTAGFYRVRTPKKGLTVLFDSIGTGGYSCCSGWTISGPSSVVGEQIWTAIQVTPTANGSVKQIAAGIGYVTGNNAAELAIYKDKKGAPGKMVWSADVSDLPDFGSTGTATVGASVTHVKLTAGTPIWVSVQTDANSSDTWDAWNESETTDATLDQNNGSGWNNYGSNPAGAVTLSGKVKN
ncbi:MAG TPA: hypothetical protein VHX61_02030 [Rhizomicrobium sp.]|jgi:hypothetical protein|nr:hypothetical protein [Rhizomicrobium sp.]